MIRPNVTDPFTEGDTVSLACTASGRPYPTIQWYKDGVLLTNESLTSIYNEEFESNGLLFTSSILELCSVDEDNIGRYSCQASNSAGNDSIEFDIDVQLGRSLSSISLGEGRVLKYTVLVDFNFHCVHSWGGRLYSWLLLIFLWMPIVAFLISVGFAKACPIYVQALSVVA